MGWQQLRRMRRRSRQAMRVQEWPWRRKVAIGAWVPVGLVGFFLFTGPNGSPSGASTDLKPEPRTVTTVAALPPKISSKQIADRFREFPQTKDDVTAWIQATPKRLTRQQALDKARWRAERQKALTVKHKTAVSASHHPDQTTP